MSDRFDVVIVGAGHGGAQAAIALRQHGFEGSIALIGDEPDYPYERPPLSKDYLAGEKPFERMLIRPARFWSERDVKMMPGRHVVAVDPVRHEASFADGGGVGHGKLIWAAGGAPRMLACAGNDLAGVHTVRARADVDAVRDALADAGRIVVIGGGYIGLETAAVLTALGKHLCLLEAQPRVLARVAGEPLSRFYEAEHRARGVDLRTGVTVECVTGAEGRATGVQLVDGEIIPADMVIVGIGIVPAVEPLLAAGAEGGDGVLVDEYCRTSLTDIYAIGDCAAHANRFADGSTIRLESVQNATDQAGVAAKHVIGAPTPYDAVPWFWSNQYDLRLQTVGLSVGHDATVVRGDPAARSFSVIYLKAGRVIALDCVNATKDYVQGRKLIIDRIPADVSVLANISIPLRTVVEEAA